MNLKRRIERMERDMKPAALRAVIQGLLGHSAPPARHLCLRL